MPRTEIEDSGGEPTLTAGVWEYSIDHIRAEDVPLLERYRVRARHASPVF